MKTRHILPILAAVIVLAGSHRAIAVEIDIDCGLTIVRRPVALRYGVDVNYLIDSDRYDPARKIKFRQSLKDLNVKAIRWNEGEIGDKMIWAIPPFTTPDVHATHQRTPGTVHYNWRVDEKGKMKNPMELDEVISIAKDLKLELFIIIGTDAIWLEEPAVRARNTAGDDPEEGEILKRMTDFAWATEGKTAREMIVTGSEALARYLRHNAPNLEVFLEIGNENYLGDARWKPEHYAALANVLSKKIADVNPRIHIGVQLANQYRWTSVSADGRGWNDVLRKELDLSHLDHLIVHQYGYKDTLNLDSALSFLDSLSKEEQARLELNITELGSWHLPGAKERWSPNDLRTSLYQFRWLGLVQQNGKGRIRTPLFWTTRWLDALKKGAYEKSFNALNLEGELTPSGMAIKIWNDFVHDSLVTVRTSGDAKELYCYASMSRSDPAKLTVWLANNQAKERKASLNLRHLLGAELQSRHTYAGDGPNDTHPELKRTKTLPLPVSQGNYEFDLSPYSMQILCFTGRRPTQSKERLQQSDASDGK